MNPRTRRGRKVTLAEFSRLWFDTSLTLRDIGRALDISPTAAIMRARHRGLPERAEVWAANTGGYWAPPSRLRSDPEFAQMWCDGVATGAIAAHFGIDRTSVHRQAVRLGLPRRPVGKKFRLSVEGWRRQAVLRRMTHLAEAEVKLERAQRFNRVMDGVRPRRAA